MKLDVEKIWREFECSDEVAINITGYQKRAYIYYERQKIYIKSTYCHLKYNIVVVIYQNTDNMMDSLLEFHIHNYESNTTTPIPRRIICRYFESKLYFDCSLVNIYGRCFVKGMNYQVGLRFAYANFVELLLQFLYPKINSIDSVNEVITSYYRLASNKIDIKNDRYASSKVNLMNEIKKLRKYIEKQMSIIDTCASRSADAINELSEKFGIEVVLTDE